MSHFSEQWLKDHGYVQDSRGDWAKPAKAPVLHAPAVQTGSPAQEPPRKRKATRRVPDSPILEPGAGDGALGKEPVQKSIGPKFLVRITAIRKRLLDEDNICSKFATDLLRYASIIPGDSPDQTRIEVRQRKPIAEEEEHNLIEVFEL